MRDDTYSLIAKLNYLMSEMLTNEMKKIGMEGLAPSYGKILLVFSDRDSISMKELSKKIAKTPQTVTTLVTNLEKRGYVDTKQCPNDKRSKYVCITAKGKELFPKISDISEKLYDIQYIGMSDDDIQTLRNLVGKMIKNFANQ